MPSATGVCGVARVKLSMAESGGCAAVAGSTAGEFADDTSDGVLGRHAGQKMACAGGQKHAHLARSMLLEEPGPLCSAGTWRVAVGTGAEMVSKDVVVEVAMVVDEVRDRLGLVVGGVSEAQLTKIQGAL